MQFILLASDLQRDFKLKSADITKAARSSSLYTFLDEARNACISASDASRQDSIDRARMLHDKSERLVVAMAKLKSMYKRTHHKSAAMEMIRQLQ